MRCKFCGSYSVVRYGTTNSTQRWKCKACGHTSRENGAPLGLKYPTEQIITALKLRKVGLPLEATRDRLITLYNCYPSISTIREWERNPRLQLLKKSYKHLVSCITCGCEWEVGELISCPHCSR